MSLLEFNDCGIYCPGADVYIDPWKPVKKALITHAHSDHARPGNGRYICSSATLPMIRSRLGEDIDVKGISYGQTFNIRGISFSFHPAGHIPGSAQIKVEHKGEVWVVSGDYKTEDDGLCEAFVPLRCHSFITESTFGLPVYRWPDRIHVLNDLSTWWEKNRREGKVSVVAAYALGKAQSVIFGLKERGPVYTHGAVENVNEVLRSGGYPIPATVRLEPGQKHHGLEGAMVICPPSALNTTWMRRLGKVNTAFCSGWMALRGARRRRAADRGFILSDHADWNGLNEAVKATGAENIYVTHGYRELFARWLREECSLNARAAVTHYEDTGEEEEKS